MEKSDLDTLLLTEVFRCLPKLNVVRMDVISVHRVDYTLRLAYCGARATYAFFLKICCPSLTSFDQPALTETEFLDRIATFMHVRDAQIQLPLNESWIE